MKSRLHSGCALLAVLASTVILAGLAMPDTAGAPSNGHHAGSTPVLQLSKDEAQSWVIRSRFVDDIDLAALHFAAVGSHERLRIDLPLFDDTALTLEVTDASFRNANRFTVVGVVPRAIGSNVTISVCNDAVYGVITVPRVGTYEIRSAGDGWHLIRQLDQDLMPGCGVGPGQFIAPPAVEARDHGPLDGAPLGNEPAVIDVLVAYTPAALDAAGGESGMLAMIDTAMSQTNQALVNSATSVMMELVNAREVEYDESDDVALDLFRLQDPDDGYMDEVHIWRDEEDYADLVALLSHHPNYDACGVGFIPGGPIAEDPDFFAQYAFSVTWTDCLPGARLAHELAHNLGCHHDNANTGGGIGSFPYSHGHQFVGDSGSQWRTVMAYPPGETILNYSNPVVEHDGQPTGQIDNADNAATIDNNSQEVSIYRNLPPAVPPDPVIADVSCDGVLLAWPDGASPPAGVTWYWQGTTCDQSTEYGSDDTFFVEESGTYRLQAVNDTGEWSLDCGSHEVEVPFIPQSPPDPIVIESGCETATLSWPDGAAPARGVSWYWQVNDCGEDTSLGSGPTFEATDTAVYRLRARHDDSGCWSDQCGTLSFEFEPWDNEIGVPGMNSGVSNFIEYDREVIAVGSFLSAGGVSAKMIARWDGVSWGPVGSGINSGSYALALAVFNGDLVVGGQFSAAGGVSAKHIARWDGESWHSLGAGIFSGNVRTLAVFNGELIVGGSFGLVGDRLANNIARWDGSTWHPLGAGASSPVHRVIVHDGQLFVGGQFNQAGDQWVNNIARWDGSKWHPLGDGLNDYVSAMTIVDGDLVVAGGFTMAGQVPVDRIARWDGEAWHPFAEGVNGDVARFLPQGDDLIAVGTFTMAGDVSVNHVARWDGSAWHPMGTGMNDSVFALIEYDGQIMAGGVFYQASGLSANRVASWTPCSDGCATADLNCDDVVDGADLAILLGAWGTCGDCDECSADLDGNCKVNGADLAILLGNWG